MNNAAHNLKNLLQQEDFKSGETLPTSFVILLSDFCDLIISHNDLLQTISDKMNESPTKSEVLQCMDYIKSVKEEMINTINEKSKKTEDDLNELKNNQEEKLDSFGKQFTDIDEIVKNTINSTLSPINDAIQENENELLQIRSQLAVLSSSANATNETITQIRSTIPPNPEARLNNFSKRMDLIETSMRNAVKEIKEKNAKIKGEIAVLHRDDQEIKVELHDTILEIEAKAKALPLTYQDEDNQPKIVNGEVDISPLIRGIYRDSKRLDGFNEMISMARLETEDVVNSIIDIQDKMQQFNHIVHDLAIDDGKIRTLFTERVRFLHSSIRNLEKQVEKIWTNIFHLSESNNHSSSNISNTFDQLQSILTSISNRPLPAINDLSDVLLECHAIHDTIFEEKNQFDGEREKFKKIPGDYDPYTPVPDLEIKKIHRRTKPIQDSVQLPYNDIKVNADKQKQNRGSNTINERTLEELRVKMNEVLLDNEALSDQFELHMKSTQEALEIKVDVPTMDRVINKVHDIISNLSKRLDKIENSEKNVLEIQYKKSIKDPNGPTIKTSPKSEIRPILTSTNIEVPLLKVGNAAKPINHFINEIRIKNERTQPKLQERPKTSQRLASDRITVPMLQIK